MIRRVVLAVFASMLAMTPVIAQSGAPPNDRIKLNGVWALEIRNPDGTVTGRTTFHNALTVAGQGDLTSLMAGAKQVYTWIVTFNEPYITSPSDVPTPLCAGTNGQCRVFLSNGPYAGVANGTDSFSTMTMTTTSTQLIFTGSFAATRASGSQIERVATHLQTGVSNTDVVFTLATPPAPQPVSEGQIVQFTYTVSFQ